MEGFIVAIQIIIGFGLLAFGAERFIASSALLAKRLGLPSLLIGMLLVGFGTSFPEMVVSAIAAIHGSPSLAIGNAVGSNIMNIGMVLGFCALLTPIFVTSDMVKREIPILIGITVIVGLMLMNGWLARLDGLVLIVLLGAYLYWMLVLLPKYTGKEDALKVEIESEMPTNGKSMTVILFWWVLGLVLLFLSSELIVQAAVTIARWLQISELVIGLTVVAIGTSLPELAASVMGVLKGEPDMAVGNVIGSNIFNLLAVLVMPALISPSRLPKVLMYRDYPIMLLFTLVFWLMTLYPKKALVISRFKGAILFSGFIGFLVWMVLTSLPS